MTDMPQAVHPVRQRPVLAAAMFADFLLCATMGIMLMLRPQVGAVGIGLSSQAALNNALWFIPIGIVLQFVAAFVFSILFLLPMPNRWVWVTVALNVVFVAGTYAVWLAGIIPPDGVQTMLVLANIVLVIAVLEVIGVLFNR
jgi:hypothetical protein